MVKVSCLSDRPGGSHLHLWLMRRKVAGVQVYSLQFELVPAARRPPLLRQQARGALIGIQNAQARHDVRRQPLCCTTAAIDRGNRYEQRMTNNRQ